MFLSEYTKQRDFFLQEPTGSHMKIFSLVEKGKKILDVGCLTGRLGERLVKEKGCHVIGIEIDPQAARLAKTRLNDVIVGDVEKIKLDNSFSRFFDIIIFGDILEHLKKPDEVLKRFKGYLRDDGYVIVSIPNFGHWLIRLICLTGRFSYQEGGILDRTHLRFYTYSTAKRLLESCRYKIVHEDVTISYPDKFRGKIDKLVVKIRKNLGAFQFIFKAIKD